MKIKIPLQIVEPEENNFHLILPSEFENGTKGNWVVDTGASKSVFDAGKNTCYEICGEEEEILSAGIGEQPLKSAVAILNPFHFGKLKIEKMKVALIDLSHINQVYLKKSKIEILGLLGSDFLKKYKAEISYKKKLLILKA